MTLQSRAADAYFLDERWAVTASGVTRAAGTPITLTWSLAPDGTSIRNSGPSNLVSYLDGLFNVSNSSSDLAQRPWFHVIEESFVRWSQLSGITFVYEPNDDGARLQDFSGLIGARGDVRIGGRFIDGPAGTLAYSYLPDGGDIVFDTGDTNLFTDSAHNYRRFRNTLMHELGHAFGLLHIESSTDALLMEPLISSSIDGPQLDDIRGIQALYGDPLEKSYGGLGNGIAERATSLGVLPFDDSLAIGSDAVGGQAVDPTETDFVSIANHSDVDFYSFTISAPALLNAILKPLGGVFSQGLEADTQSLFDANARSNLALAVFADDGTTRLSLANYAGAGQVETIIDFALSNAGTYFMRVTGSSVNVQLYQLQLSATAFSTNSPGDYNQDGVIDAADYVLWRHTFGQAGAGLTADGDFNGIVDQADYGVWRANFGARAGSDDSGATVAEPTVMVMLALASAGACLRRHQITSIVSRTR